MKKIIAFMVMIISLAGGCFVYNKVQNAIREEQVTVTFDVDGELTKVTVLRGAKVEIPVTPTKIGHHFVGWDNQTSLEVVTKDEVYKALFEVNQYTINFNSNSNAVLESITYDYGEEIEEFDIPTKEGYEFVGWYYQGVLFDSKTMPAYNVDLEGIWYSNITFNSVNGIAFESLKGIPGEKITAPVISEEYQIAGETIVWYTDSLYEEVFTFNRMPEEDLTLYGRFEKIIDLETGFLDAEIDYVLDSYEDFLYHVDYLKFNRMAGEHILYINYSLQSLAMTMRQIDKDTSVDVHYEGSTHRDGNRIILNIEFEEEAFKKASSTDLYHQLSNTEVEKINGRNENFEDFAINKLKKVYPVFNSEQLYYVIERGYKPIFNDEITNSNVVRIYETAKYILRNIITDNMNDYEKVHAIYDWLVINVTYDKRLRDYTAEGIPNPREYRGFFLEGVFLDKRAVCDGFAKAFVLMCGIEGIKAIRVEGVSLEGTYAHAWNKVRLDNMWYVVDTTNGGTIVKDEEEIMNHNYLLTNDDYYNGKYLQNTHRDIIAYGKYDIYQEMFFEFDGYQHDFYIQSQDELNILIEWYTENYDEETTLDCRIAFDYGESIIDELKTAINYSGIHSLVPLEFNDDKELENGVLIIKNYTK